MPDQLPEGFKREKVWDYPRPPLLETVPHRIKVVFAGQTIADSSDCFRVLETSHPPTYYIPPEAFASGALKPVSGRSLCEWKGAAQYFDVVATDGTRRAERAAWCYPTPTRAFERIRDFVSLYASQMDRCSVGPLEVMAQDGDFYGGWITPNLEGPFKGAPGTLHW
ncbi:MAG: DUF427 domain-containing protein [Pseudomonadota bacterium]